MTSAMIHYFSATGNSYHAATVVERRLKEAGYNIEWQRVEGGTTPPDSHHDLHLFTFPVYATDMPDIMAKYMWKLPRGNGAKAAIIATNGSIHATTRVPGAQGDPGSSFDHARLILWLKGYQVVLADAAPYPHSVTIGLPVANEAEQSRIIDLADRRVDGLAQKLVKGERSVRHNLLLAIIYVPTGLTYGLFGRHFIGKLYVADGKCNGCGICAKTCPVGSIRLTAGKPSWNWRCQGCMRCINMCPKHAINTSIARIALLIAIPLLTIEWWPNTITQSLGLPTGIVGITLSLIIGLAILYGVDKAL
ncbi:MAG TPA: EFR1 family ferrodoxin, partial [Methanocella sp.]|nr:EFR1 family ferrodoxin [Methanocella sp.]